MFNKPHKTESEVFQDEWIRMHQIEWLFPQNFDVITESGEEYRGPTSSEEYLQEFARKNRLFVLRCPAPYKFGLLEKYKDKVALSGHISANPAVVPYTVFQLNGEKAHLIVDWVWDPEEAKFSYMATLFIVNQLDYVKFLADNREFEASFKEQSLGFHPSSV